MAFEAEGRARGVLRTLDPQVEHLEASVGLKQKASGPKSHCVAFDPRQESQQAEVEKLSKELEVRFIPISRPELDFRVTRRSRKAVGAVAAVSSVI